MDYFTTTRECVSLDIVRDHRKLRVWKESFELALDVYRATELFPRHELFGLTAQLRRAAVSVGSNITEGAARASRNEFARFLEMASASASECSFHLQLARDLGYLSPDDNSRLQTVSTGLRRQLTVLRMRVLADQ